MEKDRKITLAVIGNPNTGKSTLFNALCGTRQHVGNYPGVTIEKKIGKLDLPSGPVDVIDLPGAYSLKADSYDEQVVVEVLMGRLTGQPPPDLILFVLDSTNIKRNLYLFTQVAEMELPVIVILTMTDLLASGGVELDQRALEKELGVPVVAVAGGEKDALQKLKLRIFEALRNKKHATPHWEFPARLNYIVDELYDKLRLVVPLSRFEVRNLLFFPRDPLNRLFLENEGARLALDRAREQARETGLSAPVVIAVPRYQWAEEVTRRVESRRVLGSRSLTEKIDALLTHRILGLFIFIGLMYLVFASIYLWAAPVMDAIEALFGSMSDGIGRLLIDSPALHSLISDGVIGGVGSVMIFVPQIAILFLFIAVMEDSGYLARAAFMMDKLLAWTGLNGRAFIPMLSSFACAVPGVMAARIMTNPRARLVTVLIAPLMSCSARLPVYVLMIGAFIEPRYGAALAGFTLFMMHAVGVIVALPIAWFLNHGVLSTPTMPFMLELPPYRRPHLRTVAYRVWEAVKKFVVRSGTVIFALTVIVWALTYFPRPPEIAARIGRDSNPRIERLRREGARADLIREAERSRDSRISSAYLEQSYLGRSGKWIQPLFAPLGYDWKITVGILGAFPAREVIIATLGIIYSVEDVDEESVGLRERMQREKWPDGRPVFTPLVAFSIMIFFALCCQCMSTVITVQRELKSWGWALFLFVYMTALAYLGALLVYNAGRLFI